VLPAHSAYNDTPIYARTNGYLNIGTLNRELIEAGQLLGRSIPRKWINNWTGTRRPEECQANEQPRENRGAVANLL